MSQQATTLFWSLDDTIARFFDEEFQDGDLISHDWLRWALEINEQVMRENDFALLERMEQFKAALLYHHKIALQNVRGEGYRIVPPAEQARYAAQEASRYIGKGMRKASDLLTHTHRDALDKDEMRRHVDTEVRIAGLQQMVSKGQRDVFALFEPKGA